MALSRRTGNRFQASIWPGFVDAMTALLLVLMFVLSIFMIVQFVLRETITGQADKLDALAAEVAALSHALGLERGKSASLTDRVGELSATLGDARARAERQAALIAGLRSERAAQAEALEEARGRIASFEEQVASLLAERDTNLGTIAELEETRETLMSEREQLNLALAGLRDEIDARAEEARLAAARREALEALTADLRRRFEEGQEKAAALTAQIGELEAQLSEEEAERLAEAAAAQALRDKLENAETELTSMTLALEEERRRAEETLTLLAAAEAAEDDLDLRLAAALLARDETEEQLAAALAQAEEQGVRATSLADRLAGAEAMLADLRGERDSLAARVASLSERAESAEKDAQETQEALISTRGELEARLERLETDLAALRVERGDALTRADRLETELAEARKARIAAETAAAGESDEIADLAARLARTQAALDRVRGRLAEVLAANETAQAEARDAGDLRRQLAAALAAKLAAESAAAAEAAETENVRDELARALAAKLATESDIRAQMSKAEERALLLEEARRKLAEAEAARDAEAEEASEAQKAQALLNRQVAALRQQLGELQALLDDVKDREAAANVQIESLGQDLNLALARAAAEERRRRELEEERRKRIEAEKEALAAENVNLEKYRSDFFGRLRDVLGSQERVRIVGDRFVFSSEVLFAPAKAELSEEGKAEIAKVAAILRSIADDIPEGIDWVLQVQGHTDDVPIRNSPNFRDNWELSQARALSVVRYMVDELGFPPGRLSAAGFGEYQPIDPADTDEARAQNRRIELKITEK